VREDLLEQIAGVLVVVDDEDTQAEIWQSRRR
jgi:hypothetical protein